MILLKTILRWILGIGGLISFLMNALEYPLLSFLYFFSSVYILPPTHDWILGKLGINLNRITRYVIFGITMIIISKSSDGLRAKWDAEDKRIELAEEKERKAQAIKEANEDIDKAIAAEKLEKRITEAEERSVVGVGKVGNINTLCVGAITEEGYDEMMTLINARDEIGLDKLVEYGYALQLAKDTQVKVIETGFVKQRVRVMSGKHSGASVYLPVMVVSPH